MRENERFFIKRIGISAVNMETTLARIDESIRQGRYNYICVAEERTTYIAARVDQEYCDIQNNSLLTVPDGIPLVWIARNMGYDQVGRVSGADLLNAILKVSAAKGYSHYFYGSTPHTIESIRTRMEDEYPEVTLKGAVSPPFQPIESFDTDLLAKELNRLKPVFFWCGLGAPKQERFIARLQPLLTSTICIGVGLAFEYMAGNVKRPSLRARKMGLEGFYRLAQQPGRINLFLVRRYVFWLRLILVTKLFGKMRS